MLTDEPSQGDGLSVHSCGLWPELPVAGEVYHVALGPRQQIGQKAQHIRHIFSLEPKACALLFFDNVVSIEPLARLTLEARFAYVNKYSSNCCELALPQGGDSIRERRTARLQRK